MVTKATVKADTESATITDEWLIALSKGEVSAAELQVTEYKDIAPSIPIVQAEELLGVPFLIMRAQYHMGDFQEFVSIAVVYGENKIGILNNGSMKSGVYQQIQAMEDAGESWPVFVEKGLRKSEYKKEVNGKEIPATTYYLSN
jgi:hypothetical protein